MNFTDLLDGALHDLRTALAAVEDEQLTTLRGLILGAPRVFVAGKGRSGLMMRGFAMRLMHLGLQAHVVDDVTTPGIVAGDLLLIGSGSGRTPSLVRYAEIAAAQGAPIALLTIAEQSPVRDYATWTVRIPAHSPKLADGGGVSSALPMGSQFECALNLLLDLVTVQLMADMQVEEPDMVARHANLE
ncbi:6-phospho-3-hexuloisomerase [Aggregatilinea lenta]|uniref:6-phospho-3-hexuloisomerase n=1 Tax=Aggregatilinea lenta TaxID=913108 RepID=UPI000E5A261F|nr:6-phospho-3-hexuloisomerase [Aggregatilinea lenta]